MATLFVVSGEGFLHVVPFDQRATFFEQQPTILRPGNLIRAADSHQSTYHYSNQWQALHHVVWLQRIGKIQGELLAIPGISPEPVVGEPRHFVV